MPNVPTPIGTGNKLSSFKIGDRVIIRHMFDQGGNDFIDSAYINLGFQMRNQSGTIDNIILQHLAYQIRVKIDDPEFARYEADRIENFAPNEIELLDESPEWEV